MSTTKHTPGPWVVQNSDWKGTGLLIKPIPGQVVAQCGFIASVDGLPEMKANADLIAAAPEMLAALKEMLAWANPGNIGGVEACDMANAAIAKAEGRAS